MRRAGVVLALALAIGTTAGWSDAAPMKLTGHSHRFLVVRALKRGLRGTPISGQAWVLEDAAHQAGVNPFFIVGAAGTESSVWRAPCSSNPKNGWGMSSCGSGWYVPYFQTWRDAFTFYARYIRRQWPSARTPYDLHGYCGCGDQAWGDKTVAWERQLFGAVPTGIAYPS